MCLSLDVAHDCLDQRREMGQARNADKNVDRPYEGPPLRAPGIFDLGDQQRSGCGLSFKLTPCSYCGTRYACWRILWMLQMTSQHTGPVIAARSHLGPGQLFVSKRSSCLVLTASAHQQSGGIGCKQAINSCNRDATPGRGKSIGVSSE